MSAQKGTASSRLLSMRFMQRAAAASPSSTPSTPDGPPNKRMRMSNGASTPTTPTSDLERMKAAEAEEEMKRDAVIERLAAEAGETRWVLSVDEKVGQPQEVGFSFVQAGFADLDSDEAEENTAKRVVSGRMIFGKVAQKAQATKKESESDSEDEDDEADEDEDPTEALIREQEKRAAEEAKAKRLIKKATEGEKARQLAAKRKKKAVKLNKPPQIMSLSGH